MPAVQNKTGWGLELVTANTSIEENRESCSNTQRLKRKHR
jgi:hypothetical protein